MGKLTSKGFILTTQNEFFEKEKQLYTDIDPQWNLDPSSPDGLKVAHDAEVFTAMEEKVKQAYDARDVDKAVGEDLDILRALTGAYRNLGTPSTVELKITGVAGTQIPANSKVKTINEIVFLTDETVTIGLDGTVKVNAHCETNGAIEVSANTLTNIVNVIGGWQTVTNPMPASIGTNRDSDAVFRKKSAEAVGRAGQNQKESLFGELYATEGVRKVAIYENKTNSGSYDAIKNPHSLPPHSLAIVVDGGEDQDVAESIYIKLCPGVLLHAVGTKVDREVRSKLFPQSSDVITFSRPEAVEITLRITLGDPKNTLPTDDEIQEIIREAYMEYYSGDLIPSGIGFKDEGFTIGEMIPYFRMATPANKVTGDYEGVYIKDLKLNGGKDNVQVAFNQLAQFAKSRITVKVEKA